MMSRLCHVSVIRLSVCLCLIAIETVLSFTNKYVAKTDRAINQFGNSHTQWSGAGD